MYIDAIFFKVVWIFLKKIKMEITYDTAIPLLGINISNNESPIQKVIYNSEGYLHLL